MHQLARALPQMQEQCNYCSNQTTVATKQPQQINYCGNQMTVATKQPQEQNNLEGKQLHGNMAMRAVAEKKSSTGCYCPCLVTFCFTRYGCWHTTCWVVSIANTNAVFYSHHHCLGFACHAVPTVAVKLVLFATAVAPALWLFALPGMVTGVWHHLQCRCKYQHCFFSHFYFWYWRCITSLSVPSHDKQSLGWLDHPTSVRNTNTQKKKERGWPWTTKLMSNHHVLMNTIY